MTALPTGRALLDPYAILHEAGLSVDMHFADFGAGTLGHFVFPAADIVGKEGRVFAVDILKTALEGIEGRARLENVANVITIWGDLERPKGVNIPENSLDIVGFINVGALLIKTSDPVKEAIRLLKPNGLCLVVDWQPGKGSLIVSEKDRIKPEDVELLFEQNKFSTEKRFSAGPQHWGRVFKKRY